MYTHHPINVVPWLLIGFLEHRTGTAVTQSPWYESLCLPLFCILLLKICAFVALSDYFVPQGSKSDLNSDADLWKEHQLRLADNVNPVGCLVAWNPSGPLGPTTSRQPVLCLLSLDGSGGSKGKAPGDKDEATKLKKEEPGCSCLCKSSCWSLLCPSLSPILPLDIAADILC